MTAKAAKQTSVIHNSSNHYVALMRLQTLTVGTDLLHFPKELPCHLIGTTKIYFIPTSLGKGLWHGRKKTYQVFTYIWKSSLKSINLDQVELSHFYINSNKNQKLLIANSSSLNKVIIVQRQRRGSVVERQDSNRKFMKRWSTLDAVAHRCILGKDTECYFPSEDQAVYPL